MRFALIALLLPTLAAAQPDLSQQNSWSEKEKKEFLQFLHSGGGAGGAMPSGTVKAVASLPDETKATKVRKAAYLDLDLAADKVFTVGDNGTIRGEGSSFGPRVLYGGHIFSWVRWYTGAQGSRFRQKRIDGTRDLVNHYQFPLGIELALVPLGTPQTRYIILRGGVAAHYFDSATVSSQFRAPLIGWQGTWNASLGYEWQIPDTRLRLHAVADSYYSLARRSDRGRFFGLGFAAGAAYTF